VKRALYSVTEARGLNAYVRPERMKRRVFITLPLRRGGCVAARDTCAGYDSVRCAKSVWKEFSETTGVAVEEHGAESGRIATFVLVTVILDLDRLLAQSFADLEEIP
jgi:hypothetical protein